MKISHSAGLYSEERTRPRVLVVAPRRNQLWGIPQALVRTFPGKVRAGGPPAPAREPRALPRTFGR